MFLFVVIYSWYDLRMVMLAAKKHTMLHFGPKKKGQSRRAQKTQPEGAENSSASVGLPQQEAKTSKDSDDIEAGDPESGEGKAATGCAYTVHFARTDPRARLFCETETITSEGWCSFQGTDEAEQRPTFAT